MKDLKEENNLKEDRLAFDRFKKQLELGAMLPDMIKGKFKNEYLEGKGIKSNVKAIENKADTRAKESRWKSKYLIATRFLGHGIKELLRKQRGEEDLTEDEIIAKRKSMLIRHKALVVKRLDKLRAEEKFDMMLEKKKEEEEEEEGKEDISKLVS